MISTLPITICFTYFKSLGLANLDAALHSVRQQDFSRVEAVVIVDNNGEGSAYDVQVIIDKHEFLVPVNLYSFKHADPLKTHAWSSNVAVRMATTPWIFFCRALLSILWPVRSVT